MLKKLTLLAMAVAALAAPVAQASGPVLTNAEGEAATGEIIATGTNVQTKTANGGFSCITFNLSIALSENANTTATGSGTGSATGNPRTGSHTDACLIGALTVKVTEVTVNDIHLNGGGSGTYSFGYTYNFYSHAVSTTAPIAACEFNGTTTTAKAATSTLSIEGKELVGKGTAGCPTTGEIEGVFHLEDSAGEAVHID
jgi:hypothetical protein